MKITRRQLRQVIKEELTRLSEGPSQNQAWREYQDYLSAIQRTDDWIEAGPEYTDRLLDDITLDVDPSDPDAREQALSRARTLERVHGKVPVIENIVELLHAFAESPVESGSGTSPLDMRHEPRLMRENTQ